MPKGLGFAALLLAGAGLAATLPSPAQARGFVSIGIGVPLLPGPAYYYPPPPVVALPPPAPVYYAPAPAFPPPPAAPQSYCREYTSTTMIGGEPQTMVGTACLQPDGSWRIVR